MKYSVDYSKKFKKQYEKLIKQGKDMSKLDIVISKLAAGEKLDPIYKNHKLFNDNLYNNCWDCHIESDWVLVYRYNEEMLILLLVNTGSHSNIFRMI